MADGMPQNNHIELFQKRHGMRLDHAIRSAKREKRSVKVESAKAQRLRGTKAKLLHKRRYAEKVALNKVVKSHEAKNTAPVVSEPLVKEGAVPAYLLDRFKVSPAKALSNMIKQKRKEKAGRWDVPLPAVRPMTEDEMFRVMRTGKKKRRTWKRMLRGICFVSNHQTRKPPSFERYIRPMGLRMRHANVYHSELKVTTKLPIIGVKLNPQGNLMTSLGCITKGTILEVDVGSLGIVTQTGNIIWGKYAQVTNSPDIDGCINATLLV